MKIAKRWQCLRVSPMRQWPFPALSVQLSCACPGGVAKAATSRRRRRLPLAAKKYGHTVKGEFTGFDGYLEKLTTQMAGKTEADIVQVNWPWLPLFRRMAKDLPISVS